MLSKPTYLGDNPACFASQLCIIMGINNGIVRGREPEVAVRAKSGLARNMIPQARALDLCGNSKLMNLLYFWNKARRGSKFILR